MKDHSIVCEQVLASLADATPLASATEISDEMFRAHVAWTRLSPQVRRYVDPVSYVKSELLERRFFRTPQPLGRQWIENRTEQLRQQMAGR